SPVPPCGDGDVGAAPRASPTAGGKWLKLALLAIFVGVVVAFFALGGQRYLTLDTIKANRGALLQFTREHYALCLVIAFAVYAGATAFSLPGGLVLSLTMGFIFGRWVGTALVVIAATIGATLVFLAARYLFADAARRRMGALGAKINARL